MDIGKLLGDVGGGYHLSEEDAAALLKVRGRDIFEILSAADSLREERAGPVVTYVRNQNIHITNICKNLCGFCGFGRKEEDEGAFCDDRDTILKKVALASSRNVTESASSPGCTPNSPWRRTRIFSRQYMRRHRDSSPCLQPGRGDACSKAERHYDQGSPGADAGRRDVVPAGYCSRDPGRSCQIGDLSPEGLHRRLGQDHTGSPPDGDTHNGNDHVRDL